MVTAVTNLGRTGLADWVIQRVSAVILGVYLLFIVGYLIANPGLDFAQWQGLFATTWMRVFTLVTVVAAAAHAWIGLWSVLTDYITARMMGPKATPLRILLVLGTIAVCFIYVVWGIDILWGI